MAIYKTAKKGNFSQFDNALINNTYMSLKATMLLMKMLSKPKDWHFTIDGIVAMCKEGRTAVLSAIAELEKHGHLKRKQVRKPNGQIDSDYDVYERPEQSEELHTEKPAEEKPQAKKQPAEKPMRVSPQTENLSTAYHIYNKNIEKQKNNTNKKNTKKHGTEFYEEIVEYLNSKTGYAYKHTNWDTQKLIDGLTDSGYTKDDIKSVIDKKCDEWLGTEWEKFLRPCTLFGQKFETYFNSQTFKPQSVGYNKGYRLNYSDGLDDDDDGYKMFGHFRA